MGTSKRFAGMTNFSVTLPPSLWEAVERYCKETDSNLVDAYELAVRGFFDRHSDISPTALRTTGRGGIAKIIWLPKELGERVRETGDRHSVPYSAVLVTALYERFIPGHQS